ncbi:hypothetical protein [Clostridium sp. ZS2-4]|uniref:hypothetical protein n=1 Tax=Clostridium sp. ZS2-4 TaxID=2987703 RepID=UPI00227D4C4C|nr:hypothetical protein [Clostridium sp. ZS2-4]MCY6354607.1 hypothetical protein [Clostridium sp. ZS2-4]
MNMKNYDTFIIGHISLDEIIYKGEMCKTYGGAVLASSYSAAAGEVKTGIFTKVLKNDVEIINIFNIPKEDIYYDYTERNTSIRNEYLSDDKERRICTALSIADQFKINELPEVNSKIYHLAGLIVGDYEEEMIKYLSRKGKVAVDVQGFLRHAANGEMIFKDWKNKRDYLPYIDF